MNNTILLLGPSGIGKTTVIKQLTAKVKSVSSVILDNITHKHARSLELIGKKENLNALIAALDNDRDRFLTFGLGALKDHSERVAAKSLIVDVGTGFLDAVGSMAWVSGSPSICLISDPASAYDRFRRFRKVDLPYEQYMTTQFSKKRCAIYDKASVVLNTGGLDEQVSAHRFACTVFGMLPPEQAAIALNEWLKE